MEIYVGNLPPNVRWQDVINLYKYYGKIQAIDINIRCLSPCAFIFYENKCSALKAVEGTNNIFYNDCQLQVRLLKPNTVKQALEKGFKTKEKNLQSKTQGTCKNTRQLSQKNLQNIHPMPNEGLRNVKNRPNFRKTVLSKTNLTNSLPKSLLSKTNLVKSKTIIAKKHTKKSEHIKLQKKKSSRDFRKMSSRQPLSSPPQPPVAQNDRYRKLFNFIKM